LPIWLHVGSAGRSQAAYRGAILQPQAPGFSRGVLTNRLRHQGPEVAWRRRQAILDWYEEVQAAGGYRTYYANHEGSLQGAGTAGGLGIDAEFVESALVPLTLLYGFLGIEATAEGLRVAPRLPAGIAWLGVRHLRFGDRRYHITARHDAVTVEDAGTAETVHGRGGHPVVIPHRWA